MPQDLVLCSPEQPLQRYVLQLTLNTKPRSVEAIENESKIKELQVKYEP